MVHKLMTLHAKPKAADSALADLTASAAARHIAAGDIKAEALTAACLERIAQSDAEIGAFAHIDAKGALAQARHADQIRAKGGGIGPLHGVPVAIKDIIDAGGSPCEYGSPIFSGRFARGDAACIAALRDAGAIIIGKTVTTELATMVPSTTRNPVAPERSPGASSSGSAAAVAARMVPLAVGTQTAGSVIRPAAYCGICGMKPTFGLISRHGILSQSPPLDTVGPFARTIGDLALVTEAMTAFDERDKAMWPRSRPPLARLAGEEPPLKPVLAFVKSPAWPDADEVTREAFGELVAALGDMEIEIDEVELPSIFEGALRAQRTIHTADMAKSYGLLVEEHGERISESIRAMVEEGMAVSAVDYNRAVDMVEPLNAGLDEIFNRYDAIITPATTGVAPMREKSTGSPAFCAIWTYLGVPTISLPLLEADGLPLGVQLVGARRDDARLLRTAHWLARRLDENG